MINVVNLLIGIGVGIPLGALLNWLIKSDVFTEPGWNWYLKWKLQRFKRRVVRALSSIWIYDALLEDAGYSRQKRRQLWRDITKHPRVAEQLADQLERK